MRALATHTAGLPSFPTSSTATVLLRVVGNDNPYAGTVDALLAATRTTTVSDVGTYRYSNLGMALLGHALARAAHAPDWATLLRERILRPLGMDRTFVVDDPGQVPAGTARPHHENGWRAPFWTGPAMAPAGSSTVTTADDLAIWARALLAGTAPGAGGARPRGGHPGRPDRAGLARPGGRRTDDHLAQRRDGRDPHDPRARPRAESGRAAAGQQRA